jgi:hypothetical protein
MNENSVIVLNKLTAPARVTGRQQGRGTASGDEASRDPLAGLREFFCFGADASANRTVRLGAVPPAAEV